MTFTPNATSSVSAGEMENLLDALRYNHAGNTPTDGATIDFDISVTDDSGAGDATSSVATFTVTLGERNDTPTIVLESQPGTPEYVEDQQGDDGSGIQINPYITVEDLDGSDQIAQATVTISNTKAGDSLQFVDTSKIEGSLGTDGSGNVVLTLTAISQQSPDSSDFLKQR